MKIITEKDLKFYIRPGTTDEKVVPEVVRRNCYTNKDFVAIEKNDIWLDLGGNIGTFTVLALSKGATVITFEPELENYQILNSNVALNKFKSYKIQAAITTQSESLIPLYLCKPGQNKYRHTTKKIRGRFPVTVTNIPFKKVLTSKINAIKMDIEGDELSIIDQTNNWKNVKKLVFEYHFDRDRSIANFKRRIKKLNKHFRIIQHAKLPDRKTWDFFPSGVIVKCGNP